MSSKLVLTVAILLVIICQVLSAPSVEASDLSHKITKRFVFKLSGGSKACTFKIACFSEKNCRPGEFCHISGECGSHCRPKSDSKRAMMRKRLIKKFGLDWL